ncbi:MAG: glycosyltransferase [Oscillospiraceae bacterium]
MQLQSVIIPDEEQCNELYFRGSLSLKVGEVLTLDTYFNSFSYTKYREYTTVEKVFFLCEFSGRAKVELCVFDGDEHTVCGGEFCGRAELSADFSSLPANGFLYPKITAITQLAFVSGEYRAHCAKRDISCCIAICTYKRESYVLNNTAMLKDFDFSLIDRVFVIDNGNTLDSEAISDDFVKILPNKNYGGSGGFTRGLIEALDGGYSHVILMDDDVEFHPEVLERMSVFVSLLKPDFAEAHFSAAMLSQNVPYIQFEQGADWDGLRIRHGGHNIDVRSSMALLDNQADDDISYGAWWCFMLPVSDLHKFGLPYPFFIKMDDVEYGMRTCANSPIITMNGVAVRHEDFDNKYSMHLEYYLFRNQLVLNTIQNKKPLANGIFRFLAVSFKHLVLYRYDNIPMILMAVDDYLCGVDFFLNCDEEQLNRKLINIAPKLRPLSDIQGWDEDMRLAPRGRDHKVLTPMSVATLAGHIIPSFMLKKEIGAAPLSTAGAADVLRRRAVIQYQVGGDTGILTKRSFKKFVICSFRILGTLFKLIFGFGKARKSFLTRKDEITSEDFWRRHLEIH